MKLQIENMLLLHVRWLPSLYPFRLVYSVELYFENRESKGTTFTKAHEEHPKHCENGTDVDVWSLAFTEKLWSTHHT